MGKDTLGQIHTFQKKALNKYTIQNGIKIPARNNNPQIVLVGIICQIIATITMHNTIRIKVVNETKHMIKLGRRGK